MKKRLGKSLLVCTLALTTLAPVASFTVQADDVDSKISEQTNKISSIKEERASAEKQIASLESDIATIYAKGVKLQNEQTTLETATQKLANDINDLNIRIEKRTTTIKAQARDVQVNGQDTSFVDAILNAESVSDAVSRVQAVNTFVKANNDLIEAQKADKKAVEDKKAENDQKLTRLAAAKVELEAQRDNLVVKQADLTVQKISLAAAQATAESTRNDLLAQKAAAQAEQARIEQAQKDKAAQEAAQKAAAKQATAATQSVAATTAAPVATTPAATATETSTTAAAQPAASQPSTPATNNTTTTQPVQPAPKPTPAPAAPVTSGDPTLAALNALRASHGLNPVSWDSGLAAAATSRAASINSVGGGIPGDHWSRPGDEVLAILFGAGSAVINAWYYETNMVSTTGTGHRDWELNPNMKRVGFGYSGSVIVGRSATN